MVFAIEALPESEEDPDSIRRREILYKRVEQLRQGTDFQSLSRDTMPVVRTIESQSYPREFRLLGDGSLKYYLSLEGADKFSFLIGAQQMNGESKPAGYCVASYVRDDLPEQMIGKSLVRVHNFAVLPEYQRTGIALAGFSELLNRAAADDVSVIDAYMRDTTSYPVVMRGQELIKDVWGYEVRELENNEDDLYGNWLPNESGLFDAEAESDHHITLVRAGEFS